MELNAATLMRLDWGEQVALVLKPSDSFFQPRVSRVRDKAPKSLDPRTVPWHCSSVAGSRD
jgi:hypothetical protein